MNGFAAFVQRLVGARSSLRSKILVAYHIQFPPFEATRSVPNPPCHAEPLGNQMVYLATMLKHFYLIQ